MNILSIALFTILTTPATAIGGFRAFKDKIKAATHAEQPSDSAYAESDAELAAFLEDLKAPADADRNLAVIASDACANGNTPAQAYWYANWPSNFKDGKCLYGKQCIQATYTTGRACCDEQFRDQASALCLTEIGEGPTLRPTTTAELGSGLGTTNAGIYYPDYDTAWTEATCLDTLPLPYNRHGGQPDRPEYDDAFECCSKSYGGQMSRACVKWAELSLPEGQRPTESPTTAAYMGAGGGDYYTIRDKGFEGGTCINDKPLPTGLTWWADHFYDSMLDCCQKEYRNQASGACLEQLPEAVRPTDSPTTVLQMGTGTGKYWTDEANNWATGTCTNDDQPSDSTWIRTEYATEEACCAAKFGSQPSPFPCMCSADPCHSCDCKGTGSWADAKKTSCPDLDCDCDKSICSGCGTATECAKFTALSATARESQCPACQ